MKRLIFCCFLPIIMLATGCTDFADPKSSDKYSDIVKIATYTNNQYDSNKLQVSDIITSDTLKNFENDSDIADIFASDDYYYMSTMIDESTVLIQKNVIFQSVTGYIATKIETLNTNKNYRNPILNIPSSLGYDGDSVMIEDELGEYAEWHLYYYHAGL